MVLANNKNGAGNGCKLVLALWHLFLPSQGAGDFVLWVFSWLELHLVTTGQCYSVDVLGGSGDLVWGAIGAGRKMFTPADSQHLSHRLAAASMMVEMFVGDWLMLKFRQGRQNLILCREGSCDHFELFLFETSSILVHIVAR